MSTSGTREEQILPFFWEPHGHTCFCSSSTFSPKSVDFALGFDRFFLSTAVRALEPNITFSEGFTDQVFSENTLVWW